MTALCRTEATRRRAGLEPPRRDTPRSRADRAATLFERACHLDLAGEADRARDAYLAVLEADLGHRGALANLGALMLRSGHEAAALAAYRQAVAANPDDPASRVNLANLLRRCGRAHDARLHYEAALAVDADFPEAHQGLSYLLDGIDDALAASHRDRGFASRALVSAPYRGTDPDAPRVLQLVSARGGNIPARPFLGADRVRLHTLVVEHEASAELPPHDVVFNAIGDADRGTDALDHALRVLRRSDAPVINHPARVRETTRLCLARFAVPGVRVPRMALLPRRAFADGVPDGWRCPFLLRSPGFHTGQHFARIDAPASLAGALAALPGEQLLAIEWLDARHGDGLFRKYRAMMIGGAVLPLHLAISDRWKVHHYTAEMGLHPARRDEEAVFLGDLAGTIGTRAASALDALAGRLGLDYAGVDFGLAPDGGLLLFEANPTMVIARPGADRIWDYRRPAIERALEAARGLVSARRRRPSGQQSADTAAHLA